VLYDAKGAPQPPDHLVRRMQAIDPSLGVRFAALPSGAQWAVTQKWAPNDKRRVMIQLGQMDPDADHDIIAWIPVRVSLEDAPAWVARQWKQTDREDLRRFLDRLDVEDLEATKASSKDAMEEAMNVAEVMGSRLFKDIVDPNPRILNAGLPDPAPAPAKKPKKAK